MLQPEDPLLLSSLFSSSSYAHDDVCDACASSMKEWLNHQWTPCGGGDASSSGGASCDDASSEELVQQQHLHLVAGQQISSLCL